MGKSGIFAPGMAVEMQGLGNAGTTASVFTLHCNEQPGAFWRKTEPNLPKKESAKRQAPKKGNMTPTNYNDFLIQLRQKVDGLWYMSESDYPLEVLDLQHIATDPEAPAEWFLSKFEPAATWEEIAPDHFLRNMTRIEDWMSDEEKNVGQQFIALLDFLLQTDPQTKVYKTGLIQYNCYVLGLWEQARWFCIKTSTVET